MKKPQAGLCESCMFARSIKTSKGSEFIFCAYSKLDSSFAKYPGLPVLACDGYTRQERNLDGANDND